MVPQWVGGNTRAHAEPLGVEPMPPRSPALLPADLARLARLRALLEDHEPAEALPLLARKSATIQA